MMSTDKIDNNSILPKSPPSNNNWDLKKESSKKYKPFNKKEKSERKRFFGGGVNFKAKLIGLKDVPNARGEKMAQDVLQDLKAQKKNSGEHKQKITINISLEGLRLKDEKSGELLYAHPVHKISFISQDATDGRAFGYIFGCPEYLHTFFAIKTEKAAEPVVMCMKELFQVAFELKKEEMERLRRLKLQDLEQDEKTIPTGNGNTTPTNNNLSTNTSGQEYECVQQRNQEDAVLLDLSPCNVLDEPAHDPFFSDPWNYINSSQAVTSPQRNSTTDPFIVPAEKTTAEVPAIFLAPEPEPELQSFMSPAGTADPFNTNFVTMVGAPVVLTSTPLPTQSLPPLENKTPREAQAFYLPADKYAALADVSNAINNNLVAVPDISNCSTISPQPISSEDLNVAFAEWSSNRSDNSSVQMKSNGDPTVFSELDPLGKDRPYVDKKDFFYDVKNPPKKVLRDLIPRANVEVPEISFYSEEPGNCEVSMSMSSTSSASSSSSPSPSPRPPNPPPRPMSTIPAIPPPLPPKRLTVPVRTSEVNVISNGTGSTPPIPIPSRRPARFVPGNVTVTVNAVTSLRSRSVDTSSTSSSDSSSSFSWASREEKGQGLVIISPPPPAQRPRRQSGGGNFGVKGNPAWTQGQADIFGKKENPFSDDFFSALSQTATTPEVDNWRNPFAGQSFTNQSR